MEANNRKGFMYVQLMSSYAPAWGFGGPIRLMFDYARWTGSEGHQVVVISGDIHHDFTRAKIRSEHIARMKIERVQVFLPRLARRNINLVSPVMLARTIRLVRSSATAAVIHICELRGLVPLYGVIVKRLFPDKVFLIHSAFGMLNNKESWLRALYDRLLLCLQLRSVDLGLAQNIHEADRYRQLFGTHGAKGNVRIAVLPLHVHAGGGRLSGDEIISYRNRLRRQYDIDPGAVVVLFLGRLHKEKGIQRSIDAFLQFACEYKGKTVFLIVGRDNGAQSEIAAYIASHSAWSRIWIINDIYEQRFEYYCMADIFVGFPTIYEETMLASVEALSCGTPIVVSREADVPYVEDEGAGFVIDFDLKTASDRMLRIVRDLNGYRRRAASVALKHFSEENGRRLFLDLITGSSE